ncbi:hypothetical protein D0865_06007 [Hortaea werneckii]|uniref:Uncharacterized protein n=1 Tax=Hortaea werneckii TaxID=91943 RepID=A0A3M7CK32_HORWE|nr:hypothetical protein D0865_06007 [Hortaea werneckii]
MWSPAKKSRLVIVSNRLPVTIEDVGRGQYDLKTSSGGLVTCLRGLANCGVEFLWIGWPGTEVPTENVSSLRETLWKERNAIPVLLDKHISDRYYNDFSSTHTSTEIPDGVTFDEDSMDAYREANKAFADTVMCELRDGDRVWIHDYHLMLLPLMLRQKIDKLQLNIRLGWFLHTPFPTCDFLRVLPSMREILSGVLGADVLGFQTDQARHNFVDSCSQAFDRKVSAQTIPIGIEPSEFHRRLEKPRVQEAVRKLQNDFGDSKLILGVDRLDCMKGIPQKLHAFETLLEQYPKLVGRTILLQVVIPSREDLRTHQILKEDIHNLVGKLNGKFGKVNYAPVHFLYASVELDELTALYAVADVCFVSSLRDGMNLVSYEYVACHAGKALQFLSNDRASGSLVLSQFAGAASHLDGAFLINPLDKQSCADVLAYALNMEAAEMAARMRKMGEMVETQTSCLWGAKFVDALDGLQFSLGEAKESRRCDSVVGVGVSQGQA